MHGMSGSRDDSALFQIPRNPFSVYESCRATGEANQRVTTQNALKQNL